MLNRQLGVKIEDGLKARAAALFVQEANKYESQILIESENMKVNAKSIMGVLSLSLKKGDEFFIIANGKDEKEAIDALEAFLVAQD